MSKIQAKTKSVRELLGNVRYGIDFYQRSYAWERRHIEELLDDFEGRFTASYSEHHERMQVQHYPHYFLGTIITVKENGQTYIVDGQQRLTTLTLLLIHIHHRRKNDGEVADVKPLIFSASYGTKSFNIHVPERVGCMQALFERNEFDATGHHDLSVRNLADRYGDIQELFPDALTGDTLPYFVDWLIENVDLVEIEAYTDDDAFTIFETVNDRGSNLGPTDMLKGYLLANITRGDNEKQEANETWRRRIVRLVDIGTKTKSNEDEEFFKIWLRAKYANTIRDRKRGSPPSDFENINKFHRWVRDNKTRLNLKTSKDFFEFITQRYDCFVKIYIKMLKASLDLTTGHEAIYYNGYGNYVQYMLALASVRLDDDTKTITEKVHLVTTFVDVYVARRIANFSRKGNSTLQINLFNLMKDIRDIGVGELRTHLLNYLDDMDENFGTVKAKNLRLHERNKTDIRFLLARITAWIEQSSGKNNGFTFYTSWSSNKPFQIEHIWAYKYERHLDKFDNEYEFQRYRNRFGGLVLLPRGTNQSFGADSYEDKVKHYLKENLLAASLHPQTYEKNPNFTNFVSRSGLPFQPHKQFKRADLDARQDLYRQICEQIWNPDRLNHSR